MKVLIIYSPLTHTKQTVIDEIVKEGYKHEFLFALDVGDSELLERIQEADEIWCFGDVTSDQNYNLAMQHGGDIWIM
jgi:hypothetical protein